MSILITGMEMPPQGEFKHVRIYDNGEVTVAVDTGKEVYEAVIAHAVQLPPHGDLIDRDALSKSLDNLCDRVCQYSKAQRKVMCSACPLGDAFAVVEDDAPTIIEAEGRETDENQT